MTVDITYDQAVQGLKRAVMERGRDYVYCRPEGGSGNCVYFHDAEPSCIVGLVLSYCGLTAEDLARYNEGVSPGVLADYGVIEADGETISLLTEIQRLQDVGNTWGKSVDDALERSQQARAYAGDAS